MIATISESELKQNINRKQLGGIMGEAKRRKQLNLNHEQKLINKYFNPQIITTKDWVETIGVDFCFITFPNKYSAELIVAESPYSENHSILFRTKESNATDYEAYFMADWENLADTLSTFEISKNELKSQLQKGERQCERIARAIVSELMNQSDYWKHIDEGICWLNPTIRVDFMGKSDGYNYQQKRYVVRHIIDEISEKIFFTILKASKDNAHLEHITKDRSPYFPFYFFAALAADRLNNLCSKKDLTDGQVRNEVDKIFNQMESVKNNESNNH